MISSVGYGTHGRPATATEVANVLAFLGGDAAGYVTGVNLPIDDGMHAALQTGQAD